MGTLVAAGLASVSMAFGKKREEQKDESIVDQATQARADGQAFFQIEIAVSKLSGAFSTFGSSSNQVRHTGGRPDLLGQIEEVGWRLEHVGYVFVETGATSTNRMLGTGQGTVTRGQIIGIYLFRAA